MRSGSKPELRLCVTKFPLSPAAIAARDAPDELFQLRRRDETGF
jgi:hypothetical protein